MEDEDEEAMDQEQGDSSAPSGSRAAPLPRSIPVTDCLFCSHHSKSLLRNVAHMTKVHSFFLPDVEFLVDLKGLIRYLGELGGGVRCTVFLLERGFMFRRLAPSDSLVLHEFTSF